MNDELRRRLEALSPTQRAELSRRLDVLGVPSPEGPPQGEPRLVAYVAASSQPRPAVSELRERLARALPEHLQPADIVVVESFPRLPNHKIDRAALAATERRTATEAPPQAPSSTQQLLTRIWSMILARDDIHQHDNFFDLGGHSVLATLAVSRISQELSIQVPLRALFERPTIAELSILVDELVAATGQDDEPPLVPLPRGASPRAEAT